MKGQIAEGASRVCPRNIMQSASNRNTFRRFLSDAYPVLRPKETQIIVKTADVAHNAFTWLLPQPGAGLTFSLFSLVLSFVKVPL